MLTERTPSTTSDAGSLGNSTPACHAVGAERGEARLNRGERHPLLNLGAIEVQVRPGWGWAALVLVPGAVDGRAIGVFRGGTGTEQAQLVDLHAWPQLDGQRRDVGQLERHVPREAGVDPARRGVRE